MALAGSEKYTEKLTEQEMKIARYGENDFGFVYVQGEDTPSSAINEALKKAGGKPQTCTLPDYTVHGAGKAKPEYIITLKRDLNTILVVECKRSVKKHRSLDLDRPKDYAVDGVLYYAKYLKDAYNVIAVGISGTNKTEMLADAFYWAKHQTDFTEIPKSKNIILEPDNYLKLLHGEKVQKAYSLTEVKATALTMHDSLRINKMTEKQKPLLIAGILIALQDEAFSNDYDKVTSFDSLLENCCSAIGRVLNDGEIDDEKRKEIQRKFRDVRTVIKLRETPLSDDHSLRWYINQLEMKIKPMMDYIGSTIDALGVFYHEFISYSSGDGNALGIVLTPQHLTEFMCDLIHVDKNSHVVDICCGSGAFLVAAMGRMFRQASTPSEIEYIRKNNLYGIEQDSDIHTLALANMIIRKDGKSHIIHGDCFDQRTIDRLRHLKDTNQDPVILNKGLLNPPYSQKDHTELEFLEQELDLLCQGGEAAIVCPVSCAIGTKFKNIRTRLMEHHTLKAVFSMPDDIFYGQGVGTCVCVMVWEAKKPHDPNVSTFFGYYKDDGFVKRKKLGRVDAYHKWQDISSGWLRLYREREIVDGLTARACVTAQMEWLCEAYMKTDYSRLSRKNFIETQNSYLAYLVKEGIANEYYYSFLKNIVKREKKDSISGDTAKPESASGNGAKPEPAPEEGQETKLPDIEKWREYRLGDLFRIEKGKRLTKADMIEGEDNYLGAIDSNNGVRQKIMAERLWEPNCITVNYNGSVGEAFYQSEPFWASDDVNVLYPRGWELNPYTGLFIATVIKLERPKYNYGRKWTKEIMEKSVIKLPALDETPDYAGMENYMKSLQ